MDVERVEQVARGTIMDALLKFVFVLTVTGLIAFTSIALYEFHGERTAEKAKRLESQIAEIVRREVDNSLLYSGRVREIAGHEAATQIFEHNTATNHGGIIIENVTDGNDFPFKR